MNSGSMGSLYLQKEEKGMNKALGIILIIFMIYSLSIIFIQNPRLGEARNDFCKSIGYEEFYWPASNQQICSREEGNKIISTRINCNSLDVAFKHFTIQPLQKEDLNCKQIQKSKGG